MNMILLRENFNIKYNKHKSIIINYDNVYYDIGKESYRSPQSLRIDMVYDDNLSTYTIVASKDFIEDILTQMSNLVTVVDNTK